jgi:sirohydrochlorin cobaltochelatase
MSTTVVLVGHGSRVAAANAEFLRFVALLADATRWAVEPAFVEIASPALPTALDSAARTKPATVVVLPMILFAAGHVKADIPLHIDAARTRHPDVRFIEGTPIGLHHLVPSILAARVSEVAPANERSTAVLLVGRGSSDPEANGELVKLGRLLWEGRTFLAVETAFCGVTAPDVPEGLRRAARLRPRQIVVVPWLFFAGVLAERLRADIASFRRGFPWIDVELARPIGAEPRLVDVLVERCREALDGTAAMTCDRCKYKVRLAGFEDDVGGERALVRAVRHASLAGASELSHAHTPLRRHVLVCVNGECVAQGSASVVETLRQKLRARGLDLTVQTTKTSCLRRCGDGPLLIVYPDGVWYRRVAPTDLDEIVDVHLSGGRPVGRLVDQVLTP